jgi:hypothetical protein
MRSRNVLRKTTQNKAFAIWKLLNLNLKEVIKICCRAFEWFPRLGGSVDHDETSVGWWVARMPDSCETILVVSLSNSAPNGILQL